MTAPIIKWAGGKTKLLPELVKRMPEQYRMYYEPFFGGGALFFHLCPPNAIVGDANPALFALYVAVATRVDRVIRSLSQMQRHHNKRYYEATKAAWNARDRHGGLKRELWKPYQRAATFIYLNKTCFNGLWRVNSKGEFNVPMGDYKIGKTICDAPGLRAASLRLQRAVIRFGDYWTTCSKARDGDFVYLDPPYAPVNATANFTGYTPDGFGVQDQDLLAYRALELIDNGAQVMISNSDVPYIRSLYSGFKTKGKRVFTIHKVSAPRAINCNGARRGKVGELIITGGY